MNVVQFISNYPKVSVSGLALVMGVGGSDDGLAHARRVMVAVKRWLATPMHLRTGGLELSKIACKEASDGMFKCGPVQAGKGCDIDGYIQIEAVENAVKIVRTVPVTFEKTENYEAVLQPVYR